MLTFISSSKEIKLQVPYKDKKEISLVVKYSQDMVRFLTGVSDLQSSQQGMIKGAKNASKLKDSGAESILEMSDEELDQIKELGDQTNFLKKSKMELINEMIDLLKIQDYVSEMTLKDLSTLFNCFIAEEANSFPL
jgi:hypothetical protein